MTLLPPDRGEPELSVVIVTHGAWQLTERALSALAANTDATYELIVVDNASPDETPDRLAEVGDARVIVNETNPGFAAAVNRGAGHARADRLLLLNSDAFVSPGGSIRCSSPLTNPASARRCRAFFTPTARSRRQARCSPATARVVVYGDGDDPEPRLVPLPPARGLRERRVHG